MVSSRKVKLLEVESAILTDGVIRLGKEAEMPSMQTGWDFNFNKHIKIKNSKTYVLVIKETPNIIEGCLVFEMKNNEVPYLAYIEIAPHNKNTTKKYDYVAGCLIAYACELSFIYGEDYNEGFLTFDVLEENEANQKKLMALYCSKYRAVAFPDLSPTAMLILPNKGKLLIKEYLER